ncbi:MAG: hypothetical protein JG781_740 [Peptococcaceae bacterium]|nr:hypothetical protein [Peptococcaceae bacterium]
MTYLGAGLVAALLAWGLNVLVVKGGGERCIIWVIPWLEEFIKTGTALLLRTSIPLTHGVFGLVEAVHDYLSSRRLGFWAGLASVLSHWFFGQITQYLLSQTGYWLLGAGTAALVHISWNLVITRLFASLQRIK